MGEVIDAGGIRVVVSAQRRGGARKARPEYPAGAVALFADAGGRRSRPRTGLVDAARDS